jgi:hypothetical protein
MLEMLKTVRVRKKVELRRYEAEKGGNSEEAKTD